MLWGYHTSSETGSDKSRNISVTTDTWGKTISTVRPFHLLIFFLVPKWTLQNTDTCATYSLAFFAHHCAGHLSPKDVVNKVFECSIFLIVCKQTITQLGNTTYIIMNIHNNTYTYIYDLRFLLTFYQCLGFFWICVLSWAFQRLWYSTFKSLWTKTISKLTLRILYHTCRHILYSQNH